MPGGFRRVFPAAGALEDLDDLQRRPRVVGQVKVCHRGEAGQGLEPGSVRAGEQGGLHAVVALVEVVGELRGSRARTAPAREQAAVRQARRPPRTEAGLRRSCTRPGRT